ncbi:MAG: aldolase/citrate lyase family protein [Gemmataceae bacterium]
MVTHTDAIARVDGVDVLWVGHNDLTASLGIPGQFEHPRYQEAIRQVADTARKHGKAAGFLVTQVPAARRCLELGYRMLAYGGDVSLFQQALSQGILALKS